MSVNFHLNCAHLHQTHTLDKEREYSVNMKTLNHIKLQHHDDSRKFLHPMFFFGTIDRFGGPFGGKIFVTGIIRMIYRDKVLDQVTRP